MIVIKVIKYGKKLEIKMKEAKLALWKETIMFLIIYFALVVCFRWYPQNCFAVVVQIGSGVFPIILFWINDEEIGKLGFKKDNIIKQIEYGILMSVIIFCIVFVIFFVAGAQIEVRELSRKYIITNLINNVCVVGFGEEILWRGYFLQRFRVLFQKDFLAIILNAILFGALHFVIHENIIQVFVAFGFSIVVCNAYIKSKNITILSLIIAHGIYDFLIQLFNM